MTYSDNDLAERYLSEVSPSPDDPVPLMKMSVGAWVAGKVVEFGGTPVSDGWRACLPRVEAIASAASALLEPPAPAQETPGQVQEAQWDNSVERIAGMSRDEIDALSMEQWATARTRFGLGARPAGVLD